MTGSLDDPETKKKKETDVPCLTAKAVVHRSIFPLQSYQLHP